MKKHSRYFTARAILVFWCLFIGVGAVAGAVGMLSAPDGSALGMQQMIEYFQVLPFAEYLFRDFVFPGIALLCVNGITNLAAALLLLLNKKSGIICGMLFGFTLMAWICIQFVIFPANFMSTSYFVFGLLQACTGIAAWIFYKQEHFSVNDSDYGNIGTDHTRLVVYFSRMGYTKKAALDEAERTGADVYEIEATERTDGTPGFWWCGRYGMHRWEMPINDITINLAGYEHVTVCTPIWVFCIAAPVRSFCRAAAGKIRSADYIITHYRKNNYANAVDEMNRLLGISASGTVSICCRQGRKLSADTF